MGFRQMKLDPRMILDEEGNPIPLDPEQFYPEGAYPKANRTPAALAAQAAQALLGPKTREQAIEAGEYTPPEPSRAEAMLSGIPELGKTSSKMIEFLDQDQSKIQRGRTESTPVTPESYEQVMAMIQGTKPGETIMVPTKRLTMGPKGEPVEVTEMIPMEFAGSPEYKAAQEEIKGLERLWEQSTPQAQSGTAVVARGLSNLVDSLYGTKLMAGAPAIPSPDKLFALREKIAGQKSELFKRTSELAKMLMKGGQFSDQFSATDVLRALAGSKGGLYGGGAPGLDKSYQIEKDARDRVTKITDEFTDTDAEYGKIDAALARGDVESVSAILSNMAKKYGSETGVLTNKDIGRIFKGTLSTKWTELLVALTSDKERKYSPDQLKGLLAAMRESKRLYLRKTREQLEFDKKTYLSSSWSKGTNVGQVFKEAEDVLRRSGMGAAPTNAPKTQEEIEKNELKNLFKEFKAQKGAKQ